MRNTLDKTCGICQDSQACIRKEIVIRLCIPALCNQIILSSWKDHPPSLEGKCINILQNNAWLVGWLDDPIVNMRSQMSLTPKKIMPLKK